MISRYTHNGLTWVDLESPSREEILHVSEEFNLPNLSQETFFSSTISCIEAFDTAIYLVLHFPGSIGFIIGKNFLITVRNEHRDALQQFASIFESSEKFKSGKMISNSSDMLAEMLKQLYTASSKKVESVSSVQHILAVRQAIEAHDGILFYYQAVSRNFFGESDDQYVASIVSEFRQLRAKLVLRYDTVKELQRTSDSLSIVIILLCIIVASVLLLVYKSFV
jgi:hypothetical protein